MLQIHIGGTKRSGKTDLSLGIHQSLARGISTRLDVDEVRVQIFGSMRGVPDSPESLQDHFQTIDTIWNAMIPRIIEVSAVPITIAGHSRPDQFERAAAISARLGTDLKFLMVEAPSLEEAAERAAHRSNTDMTDMLDFNDPNTRESFLASVNRIKEAYASVTDPRVCWIPQGTREEMLEHAMQFIAKV